MNNNRPVTTLYMLMSVDGKISTGVTDDMDVDKDLSKIKGVREGLHQYYEIEQTTDLWSFNTGRVQAKMGVNEKPSPKKSPVSFVILDNHHLTKQGVQYFCALSKEFVLVTTNPEHPAFGVEADNLHIIMQKELSLSEMLTMLRKDFGCERITIQSGGTLNGMFLREKLFDYVDIVVAPVLVGGKDTATLIDGESLRNGCGLDQLGALQLIECIPLVDSYIRLRYKVI
ncbi:MAG: dihydrofolate reductase family protein [Clostridiales bacterium]|nr:dihydrofolate reductase family protein [Clostridiales bacterium]